MTVREAASRASGTEPTAANPWLMLAVVLVATFMLLVDVSIVNVAIPSIQKGLSASDADIQLVIAGYALAFAMMLITGARLGDIHGRRRLFLIGVSGFTAASAMCGAAPGPVWLIVGRVVQGLFGGLMMPQVLSVIQVTFPPRERGRALGIFGAVVGLATITGPTLGGALIAWNVGHLSWRLIFYVNVPIGALAVVGAILLLRESRAPDAPRLDIPGTVLITLATFLVVYPLVEGQQEGWPAWLLALLGVSVPFLVLFAWYERRRTKAERWPLVHMSLFGDRSFRSGMLLILVFMAGLPSFFFTLALYLQVGFGFSPLKSGLTTVPFAFGNIIGATLSHRLTVRLGRRVLAYGTILVTIGMVGVLITVTKLTSSVDPLALTPSLLVAGFGLGLFLAPVTNIVLAGIHSRAAGSASGVLSAVQQVGAALGIALVGVIFFGALSAGAASASAAAAPTLRAALAHAGVPAAVVPRVRAGFDACFAAKAKSTDAANNPPACRAAQQRASDPAIGAAIRSRVLPVALKHDFRSTFERTLVYEIAVYALAWLVVFLLPKVDLGQGAPPAAAAGAP